ncbi:ATP-binding protein [Nostoc sp.]|uniref:ATP-binding protein n=1 Tax=Nostoc sp. TaxID=1180 RepID=UPI002FFBE850
MQRSQRETVTLEDIVITEELSRRNPRPANLLSENQALHGLARQLVNQPQTMLQSLVDIALELCMSQSAGVSLLETTSTGEEVFRWNVLAGSLEQYVGGTTPRNFSPCGICLDRGTPQLYEHPDRYFTYLQAANTPIVEGLVLPLIAENHALGTIWIMSHDEQRHFDSEDVRVMTSLADFTAAALLLNQRQTQELLAVNATLEAEIVERKQVQERTRALIENLPGGAAFVVDRNLRYLLAEGEALGVAGFKTEDFVGQTIFDVLPPELAAYYEGFYRQALAGESFEHEHNAHDHTYVSRGTPLYSANGEVYAVLAVSYDISERKQAEVALRQSEERFRLFVTASSDIIYRMSADWSQIRNLKGKNILVSTEKPSDTWLETYISKEEQPQVWAVIQEAIRTKSTFELEHRVIQQDGTIGWMFSRAIPMLNEQSEIIEWFGTASDVTDRKQTEAAITQDLQDTQLLRDLSTKLVTEGNIQALYQEIMATAIALTGADAGTVQILDEATQELVLLATQDFEQNMTEHFYRVNASSNTPCGIALVTGDRTFIDFDVQENEDPDGSMRLHLEAGYLCAQSTPLITRSGKAVGMISTHWRKHHRPSDRQLRFLDLLTRQAADLIERRTVEETLHESEERQAFLLKLSDALRPLADPSRIKAIAATHLAERLNIAAAGYAETEPGGLTAVLTDEYNDGRIPSLKMRYTLSDFGSMAQRMQSGESVFFANHDDDGSMTPETWAAFAAINVRAGGAIPLIKGGTLAAYLFFAHPEPRDWMPSDLKILSETAERTWAAVERARAEAALQKSEIQRIREQAAREEERQRAEFLVELDRAKTLFFSNVSHEFRTPLTLLLAPLQDALSDSANPLTSSQRKRLELAHRNSLRLLKLVNTLLDFSRIEAGRMEAVYEPTDLALYTTELASVFRSAIERASLRLVVDCPSLPKPVYVDREMWEKIVLNLLSNAFKFTLEGEIAVKLHLADDHHVTLQVEDTGFGIEPEELPHLFERFYQVRGTKARTHEGSGIGLALVQDLIRLHGGTVDVSSTVGQGSCFTVTIPLDTAHLPSVSVARRDSARSITATRTLTSTASGATPYVQEAEGWLHQESAGRREAGEAREANSKIISADVKTISANSETISTNPETISANSETISANSKTISTNPETISANPETISADAKTISANSEIISANSEIISADAKTISANSETRTSSPDSPAYILIVDDNTDMRDYLKRILSEHDVEVEAVADGAAALAIVTERVPSLVLSDVMMPQMDGFELLKALRADARTKEIPIILLSARAGEESVIEGLQAGADDYLIKPFSATELVTRVLAHLQMAQLRSQALHQERTINRMKDKFLAEVSHELNTPLVAILGWTRLLRSSQPNQAMLMKSLETIERNATLQAKLVQDLLDISRITAGKVNLNLQLVELQQVIEAAIATVRQSYQTKNIRLECALAPLPVTVQADPDRLQQIVLNLLTNAIKFTPCGGRIEISLQTDENQAQIILSDTGCGIDARFIPYIFDTFRQASGSKKGLGLGLAIARNLVELHGGTIYAQSPGVGQGATFIVNFPLSGNSI